METQTELMASTIDKQREVIEQLLTFVGLVASMQPASDQQAQLVSIAKQIVATQK